MWGRFRSVLVAALALGSTWALTVNDDAERIYVGIGPRNKNAPSVYDFLPPDFDPAQVDPTFFNTLEIPSAWAASQLCSAIFTSGIDEERAIREEVDIAAPIVDLFVNYEEKSVLAQMKITGENPVKAIWREGVGCTWIQGTTEEAIRAQKLGDTTPLPPLNDTVPWPQGDFVDFSNIPPEVDMERLNAIADEEFASITQRVRAMLVVYKGQIIFERYGEGINKDSKLIGWSMTKSVTAALTGQLIGEGRLELDQKVPVPDWQGRFDDRQNITIRNMLNMASGIRYFEGFVPWHLFASNGDPAQWYIDRRLGHDPGTFYRYSTGSTTLLSRIVHENRGRPELTDNEYIREVLFKRIQMHNSIIELAPVDAVPLGGSHMFATARDWARFGHLYMRGGVWVDGERIIPEGWAEYTCELSPVLPDPDVGSGERYGAQWWITPEGNPEYGCFMDGFRNQNVFNVVSKDLTIVRLSMPGIVQELLWDQIDFFNEVVSCFPQIPKK